MTTYLSPLVDVNEIDLTTTVPAVATSIGVIVLRNSWKGPELKVQLVNYVDELIKKFGNPEDANNDTNVGQSYEDLLAGAGFLDYGENLYCTRALPVSATFSGAYGSVEELNSSSSSSSVSFSSSSSSESLATPTCSILCSTGCWDSNEVGASLSTGFQLYFDGSTSGSWIDIPTGWESTVDGELFLRGDGWDVSYAPDTFDICFVGTNNLDIRFLDKDANRLNAFNVSSGDTIDLSGGGLTGRINELRITSVDGSQFTTTFYFDPEPQEGS